MNKYKSILAKARALREEGHYQAALDAFAEIDDIRRLTPDQQSEVLLSKGQAFAGLNQYAKAKEFYEDALRRAELRDKWVDQTTVLYYMGLLEKDQGHYDEALVIFRRQLAKLSSEFPNYFYELARNYYQQGSLMLLKDEQVDARMYLKHAVNYAQARHNPTHAYAVLALGKLDLIQNRRKDAVKNFRISYESFKQAGDLEGLSEVSDLIAQYEQDKRN